MPHPTPHSTPDPAQVLAKAITRAADQLALPRASLARILGLSPATVTRLYRGDYRPEPDSKAGELALPLVRLCRPLHSILGTGDARRACLAGGHPGPHRR